MPFDTSPRRASAPAALATATLAATLTAAALAAASPAVAHAQTDYYNTDAGRPILVEDAYAIERRAVEIQVAPLRLERTRGAYAWGIEPELAVGLLPRTQVELGVPLAWVDAGPGVRSAGLAGLELSALYNLNVETRLPALAVAAEVLLPVGALAPDATYASLKGIATKTFPWARFHLNGQYTFGREHGHAHAGPVGPDHVDAPAHGAAELSRWLGGLAVDRPFPLESLLLTAELVGRAPIAGGDMEWSTAAGTRWQASPRVALDAGGGYRLTGGDRGWFATAGAAFVVGLPWRATGARR